MECRGGLGDRPLVRESRATPRRARARVEIHRSDLVDGRDPNGGSELAASQCPRGLSDHKWNMPAKRHLDVLAIRSREMSQTCWKWVSPMGTMPSVWSN